MKRKMLVLLFSVLLCPLAVRAQSATPTTPPQPAKRYSSLDDDPQFKRLTPEQQELVRKAMGNLDSAIAVEQTNGGKLAPAAQAGCEASPVKKPRFHLPKAVQDAINKQAKQIGSKTGVDVDANAPAKAVKDAQGKPCPAVPAAKPVGK